MTKYIVWNGKLGKALGRSTISAPMGWTFEQHAATFDTPQGARLAAELSGLIAGFEIIGVETSIREEVWRDIRVCSDCLYVDANGLDENIGDEWLGLLPEWVEDRWLWGTLGHRFYSDDDELDDCEGHFSHDACHGCGTSLGGDRYCVRAVRV
jgi:hypothetical protein